MEARNLDIIAGIVTLILFILLLLVFQLFTSSGYGYITALVLFLVIMSVAGYFINEKIT
ncbi:MAG: hypothetical protein LUP99_03765 [Methanomicrobiales archaeon]|nr:hypothetical protein [Methanomicrobiales archaeon]